MAQPRRSHSSRKDAPDNGPQGICVVDKPTGWTSHDVVARARKLLGTRKIGHSGTLDPDATGVLVLGVGRGTKLLHYLVGLPKTYRAEFVMGVDTSTLDASGEVVATYDMGVLDLDAVRQAAATLTGDIMQIPPMVSAVKIDGKRLHELAREGKEVDRPPRPVSVYRFDVQPTGDPMVFSVVVDCSSGTYVRCLAQDLGRALGGGGHLRALRRTAVGGFGLDGAGSIDAMELLPLAEGVRHLPICVVDAATAARVREGAVLPVSALGKAAAPRFEVKASAAADLPVVAVLDHEGQLLALYQPHGPTAAKPAVVLAGSG